MNIHISHANLGRWEKMSTEEVVGTSNSSGSSSTLSRSCLRLSVGAFLFCFLLVALYSDDEMVLNSISLLSNNHTTRTNSFHNSNDELLLDSSSINSNNNKTHRTHSFHNDTSSWDAMASRLCPKMIPQSHLGPQLFALARQELGNITCPPNHNVKNDILMSKVFYHWPWDMSSYQGSETANFTVSYIWKCANKQIRDYMEQRVHLTTTPLLYPYKCIVAAIRDPISHFLSGYNEVEYRIITLSRDRKKIAESWNFGKLSYANAPEDRFRQFLTDFLSCPFERKKIGIYHDLEEHYAGTLELSHVYSMTGVLHYLHNEISVKDLQHTFHYFPGLANLSTGWGPFVAQSCPSGTFSEEQMTQLNTVRVHPNKHPSSQQPFYKIIKKVWQNDVQIAKALCAIHLLDYACWRDLPDGVPDVCQELYSSYAERGLF